ncbi:MAG: helix-turn-helix transcriptional regulator [Oscillospiraceae bacterium]|nr:helix-turn-helix transcriptional regulator [Oscillospiraceae bacterium]
MDDYTGIITYSYQTKNYGRIRVTLRQALESRGITRNRLRTLTGVKYDVIDRYYRSDSVHMVDLDFFAKICYVLNCDLSELLQYEKE